MTTTPVTTVLLVGDSHLANAGKRELVRLEDQVPGIDTYNAAVGGHTCRDTLAKARRLALLDPDVLVVSLGANDCAPGTGIEVPEFEATLARILGCFTRAHCVLVGVPPVDEATHPGDRTNARVAQYADAARDVSAGAGGSYVDSAALLAAAPPGVAVLGADGLHLNDAGYDLLVAGIAAALRQLATP